MVASDLASFGLILVILGFVMAFVAVLLIAFRSRGVSDRSRSAGILLIGPIPIIFGNDRESIKILMVLAIVLVIIFLALMFIPLLVMR